MPENDDELNALIDHWLFSYQALPVAGPTEVRCTEISQAALNGFITATEAIMTNLGLIGYLRALHAACSKIGEIAHQNGKAPGLVIAQFSLWPAPDSDSEIE